MKIYVIQWEKRSGKYKHKLEFSSRSLAIFRLDYLVLDMRVYDAKLVTEEKPSDKETENIQCH